MIKAGFFYKKHSIKDNWVALEKNNVKVPTDPNLVSLYIDETNYNALVALDSTSQETILITNGNLI